MNKYDDQFKSICRRHQAWFREHVLQLPMGENPRTHRASNETEEQFLLRKRTVTDTTHLTDHDAAGLMNFVPAFHRQIRQSLCHRFGRIPASHDLMNDMLRSENIPWNIFVPMMEDKQAAINVLKIITDREDISKITEWQIEYNPKTLDDNTAFDAYVRYLTTDGKVGIIGIETKYTEQGYKISKSELERIKSPISSYSLTTKHSGCFLDSDTEQFNSPEYIQIWRNHMLAISMKLKHKADLYDSVTVYPSCNSHFHSTDNHVGALKAYESKLTPEGRKTFHYITFEALFDLFREHYHGQICTEWTDYLVQRYIPTETETEYAENITTSTNIDNTTTMQTETNPATETISEMPAALREGRREWVLNLVDYYLSDMIDHQVARARFTHHAPVASKEVSSSKYRNIDQFKRAYNMERSSTHDSKNGSYWHFCRTLKAGDIVYLAQSDRLYAYGIVTGSKVETDEELEEHRWNVEWYVFDKVITIDKTIATPFFVDLKACDNKRRLLRRAIREHFES